MGTPLRCDGVVDCPALGPLVEAFRSGFHLLDGVGLSAVEATTGGSSRGSVYSTSCSRRSRNGAQKYNAWSTELA